MDPRAFVFLDETGAATYMIRHYGWGPKDQRLIDAAPHGHRRTTTFVAGLRSTGIIAPFVLDGPMTREVFKAYLTQFLAPSLKRSDVVVMDNLSSHKVGSVREAFRAVGASSCTRRPTPQTSTRSSRPSPDSRRCSERPPPEPATLSGIPSDSCSMSSRRTGAETTPTTQDMHSTKNKMF